MFLLCWVLPCLWHGHPPICLFIGEKQKQYVKQMRTNKQAYNKEGQWMMICYIIGRAGNANWIEIEGMEAQQKEIELKCPLQRLRFWRKRNNWECAVSIMLSVQWDRTIINMRALVLSPGYLIQSKFRITCKSKKVKFRGKVYTKL